MRKRIIAKISGADIAKYDWMQQEADHFGHGGDVARMIARYDKYDPRYIIAEEDAALNYGLPFSIWAIYTIPEGMVIMNRICFTCSIISSGGLRSVHIYNDTVAFGDKYYSKDGESRKEMARLSRELDWIWN